MASAAGKGNPLLLPTRELMREAAAVPRQSHQLEELVDTLPTLRAPGKPEGHIASHAQMREQRALLRHVPDATTVTGHEAPAGIVDHHSPDADLPLVRPFEAGHDPQQRGLAAARRTEDGGERTGRHGQIHPAQDGLGPEGLGDTGDAKVFHVDIILVGNSAPGASGPGPAAAHPAGLAVEPTAEHIAGHRRDEHHHAGIRGGLGVGHVRLEGPELGRQRLHVRRVEDEGGRELRRRLEEDQRERGDQAGPHQGQRDAPQDRASAHAERAGHLFEPDRRPGHGGTHGDHRQREEHDGVGHDQQRGRLVEAALQEVLGHVGEAQRDHQAGHGEDHQVRSLQARAPCAAGSAPTGGRSVPRPAWPRRRPPRHSRTCSASRRAARPPPATCCCLP